MLAAKHARIHCVISRRHNLIARVTYNVTEETIHRITLITRRFLVLIIVFSGSFLVLPTSDISSTGMVPLFSHFCVMPLCIF